MYKTYIRPKATGKQVSRFHIQTMPKSLDTVLRICCACNCVTVPPASNLLSNVGRFGLLLFVFKLAFAESFGVLTPDYGYLQINSWCAAAAGFAAGSARLCALLWSVVDCTHSYWHRHQLAVFCHRPACGICVPAHFLPSDLERCSKGM